MGSLQKFESGFTTLYDLKETQNENWKRIVASGSWGRTEARIRAIDYLLGNHDRLPNSVHRNGNFKNIMLKFDPKNPTQFEVALIDNGVGRPGRSYFDINNAPVRRHLPKDLLETLQEFDEAGFRQAYAELLPTWALDDVIARIQALRTRDL